MIYVLTVVAVAVGAISGALTAGRKQMDGIGVLVLASVTAVGGGTIRDVLLGVHPLFWVEDQTYLCSAAIAGLGTMWTAKIWLRYANALMIADAFGLALFTAMGAEKALNLGLGPVLVVVMGVITGVAGGIIRDVLAAEVSAVFIKGQLYASAAIAGVVVFLLLLHLGAPRSAAVCAEIAVCLGLRLAAVRWNWTVPVFHLRRFQ